MKNLAARLGCAFGCAIGICAAAAPEPPDIGYVLRNLKPAHPRLFLNPAMLEKVRQEGLTPAQRTWLTALMRRVDRYPQPPVMDKKLVAHMLSEAGGYRPAPKEPPKVHDGDWGFYAAHAALAYLLGGEKNHFEKAVGFLRHATGIYTVIHENKRVPYGKAFGRLSALSAYDWLHNDLSAQERREIGGPLFSALHAFHRHWRQRGALGIGIAYDDEILGWYLGLVFHGTGVPDVGDDAIARLLEEEYGQYVAVFRKRAAGPDGIEPFGAVGYTTQLLQSEINFLDAWRVAFGENFARYFPRRIFMANYFLWNTIAPTRQPPLCHGWSDTYHTDNRMDLFHLPYLNRVADLYGDLAGEIPLEGLAEIAQFQSPRNYERFLSAECCLTPASPLYISSKEFTDEEIRAVLARLPKARHFPDPVGQTFMNSGWDPDAIYALFVAGRQSFWRKHYDENHFTIYKKGFLAMDTGGRLGGPGHGANYYHNTIAHNCVLIHMDGEVLPGLWGENAQVNTGGMNKNHGAVVRAFETNEHYSYIASDATACYHPDKSHEVIRQFVFIHPDCFVVSDRVASRKPQQKKTWLLHTQHEPEVRADTFQADHGDGRIFVRTLLPQTLNSVKVGGPGREFWSGDRNWPLSEAWQKRPPDKHLFGQWRMEISSGRDTARERFLHLIQVGDRQTLNRMAPSELIDDGRQAGVRFTIGGRITRVLFNKEAEVGGHIRITQDAKVLVDRPFTDRVQEQTGLDLKPAGKDTATPRGGGN